VRAKKDVPIIEENWSIIENDSPNVTWARGNKLIYTKKPFHLYKEIRYLDENRVVEIDAVHYQQSDSASYRLLITSLFEDHVDVKTKEYKLIIYHPGKFPPSKTKTLTGYAADSILNTWRSIQ
jgi:hypothetical protein